MSGKTEAGDGTARGSVAVAHVEVLLPTRLSEGCPAPPDRPGSASGQRRGSINSWGMAADRIDPSAARGVP